MNTLLSNFKISVNPDIYLKDPESSELGRKIAQDLICDYKVLLKGEERKFELGESSLFVINSREAKLIESQVKDIVLENELLGAKSELYKIRSLTF